MTAAMSVSWPDRLFDAFKRADIRQVGYVPDAGHARLIERCQADPDIRADADLVSLHVGRGRRLGIAGVALAFVRIVVARRGISETEARQVYLDYINRSEPAEDRGRHEVA